MTGPGEGVPGLRCSGFRGDNLRALGRRFPELEDLLGKAAPAALEAVPASAGPPTARAGGRYLHSRYDPEGEARRAAASIAPSGADTVVVLGPGLGYAVQAVLAELPDARVVAAAADPALLAACMDVRDLSRTLSDDRVSVLAGGAPEGLLWAFERLGTRKVRVLENKAEAELFPQWYARAKAVLARWEAKEAINANTLKRFGRLWVRNLARNLDEIPRRPGVSALEGRFAGLPALVAAAGPSLDEVLPLLPELRERAVLVCVDTALRSLLRAGIQPDFVVVVDPQYWNARHLDRCEAPGAVLVTEGAAWPSVFRLPFAAVRLCSSLYPLGTFAETRSGGPKGRLGAGGSVATTAWDFARVLGCRPVYMAGLDLGFPGFRTHARASRFEQKALAEGRRLRPPATRLYEAYAGARPRDAGANDGGTVRTDERLALYSWWFESRMLRHPECPTRNLSPGGLAIAGMPLELPETLRSLPRVRDRIDEGMEEIRRGSPDETRPPGAGTGLRGEILGLLASMEAKAGTALVLAARTRDRVRKGGDPRAALARMDRADRELLGNEAKEIAGFLFPDLEELLGRPARTLEEALDRSEAVYREIRDSAVYHRKTLA